MRVCALCNAFNMHACIHEQVCMGVYAGAVCVKVFEHAIVFSHFF